jgi:3-phytase
MGTKVIFMLSVLSGGFCCLGSATADVFQVMATVETEPVSHSGDSADDAKVWVHPTEPNHSVIIGTDKHDTEGGLAVYDLTGRLIFFAKDGKMNNVDVRYNFPMGNMKVDIIAVSNRTNDSIAVYTIDPSSRRLTNIAARTISVGVDGIYGQCLYHSLRTGKYYAFVNDKKGEVEQWELFDNQNCKVDAVLVRSFDVGTQTEGMVADDQLGYLYVGEEDVGIWKYSAEPNDPADSANRVLVDSTNTNAGAHLVADVEGLTIFYARGGGGYLIASSQGEDNPTHPLAHTFAVYRRDENNEYVMSFRIAENTALGIDAVSNTDGIGVIGACLGHAFPKGLFVAQDGHNSGGNQNFKLVPWEKIATSITPNLLIDTEWNPRRISIIEDLTWDGIIDINDITAFLNRWLEKTQSSDTNDDHTVDLYDLHAICSEWLRTGLILQADFNRDKVVDFRDFSILGSEWRQKSFYLLSDFNKDGHVNFRDFAKLAGKWLWQAG